MFTKQETKEPKRSSLPIFDGWNWKLIFKNNAKMSQCPCCIKCQCNETHPAGLWKCPNCLPDTSSDCSTATVIRLKLHVKKKNVPLYDTLILNRPTVWLPLKGQEFSSILISKLDSQFAENIFIFQQFHPAQNEPNSCHEGCLVLKRYYWLYLFMWFHILPRYQSRIFLIFASCILKANTSRSCLIISSIFLC